MSDIAENWQPKLAATIKRAFAGQADGAHDVSHIERVWRNCLEIAASEPPCDVEILIAAAYLHDIVSLPKNSPHRHRASTMAALEAKRLLTEIGFPPANWRRWHMP